MTTQLMTRVRSGAALLGLLALVGGLSSCDSNAWSDLPTGGGSNTRDGDEPSVLIVQPDSTGRVAVGDSVLIQFQVADDAGIDSVRVSGFALRGSAQLGTQTRVERFVTKTVNLSQLVDAVRDTTISRYLLATSDSLAEDRVYLTVSARDVAGNLRADTVQISVGGPRLQILSPLGGSEVRAGTSVAVRLSATDSVGRIQTLGLRLNGAEDAALTLQIDPPVGRVDTTFVIDIPTSASGPFEVRAFARTMTNDSTVSAPLILEVLAAAGDRTAPQVSFSITSETRKEVDDTIAVTVVARDSTEVGRVGVTVRPTLRFASSTQAVAARVREDSGADSVEFRFALSDLGAVQPSDTSYVLRLEVTAFAVDTAGNCATATVPDTRLSQPCTPLQPTAGDSVLSSGPGVRRELTVVRGATTLIASSSDRLVDLVADSIRRRVFVSNLTRNRVEVLAFGGTSFSTPISVGSEPWGLAINRSRDTLYVANSAGTNISVVPLAAATLAESRRIRTADIRLYGLDYEVDSDSATLVTEHDYSDRPQFLAQVSDGQIVYSTKPTATRSDGTVRIFDPAKDTTHAYNRGTEIFSRYATPVKGHGIVVNALSAALADAGNVFVCPRRLLATQADPGCLLDRPTAVSLALAGLRAAGQSDTRLDLNADIASVGLTDTTFVAVSRDHSTVAFGEGAVDPGRIFLFRSIAGTLTGSTTETRDLVGNAAERVIGLGLNGDGSLGIARGRQSYFFEEDLRLQGVVASGTPSGGVSLHPMNSAYPGNDGRRRAFVSGVDEGGAPYVDVVDSYSFRTLRRIRIRDAITGTLVAVPVGPNDPQAATVAVRLFGITAGGVVQIGLSAADIQ